MHSQPRGISGQRQAARPPAPKNNSPSSPLLSPLLGCARRNPFCEPDPDPEPHPAPDPPPPPRPRPRPLSAKTTFNMTNKDLHVRNAHSYCGDETKGKSTHSSHT